MLCQRYQVADARLDLLEERLSGPFAEEVDLGCCKALLSSKCIVKGIELANEIATLAAPGGQQRMGMRVQAVWKPREQWGLGIDNIDYFRPTGEPDAHYDTYKHHL